MAEDPDPELRAMGVVLDTLSPLDELARARVLDWVNNRLGIKRSPQSQSGVPGAVTGNGQGESQQSNGQVNTAEDFSDLGELFAAAAPTTDPEKALVVGYWLQVRQENADLTGFAINKELKHLGHGVSNVTHALTHLQEQDPALAIQVRKSGSSQQSRKKYKITRAGVLAVEAMLSQTT